MTLTQYVRFYYGIDPGVRELTIAWWQTQAKQ